MAEDLTAADDRIVDALYAIGFNRIRIERDNRGVCTQVSATITDENDQPRRVSNRIDADTELEKLTRDWTAWKNTMGIE